jgi:hypothetical protein
VAYLGFGVGVSKALAPRISPVEFPVEIEFGADDWVLSNDEAEILSSHFENRELARGLLARHLIGKTVAGIEIAPTHSTVSFDGDLVWTSSLDPDPASGFLYSFYVDGGPTWETVDGISVRDES